MPTPRNKPPRQDILFSRDHLRYALTRLAVIKNDAKEYAEKEIPSAEHAPAVWAVRVTRSPTNKFDANKKRAVLRYLKLDLKVNTWGVVKNCPRSNKLLKMVGSLVEIKPLRILEDADLPNDKSSTLLTSQFEFHTHPLKKSDRLLELEKLYKEKCEKEGKPLPTPRPGVGRSHIEMQL
eukprot:scpid98082/ scgid33377/ 